MRQALADLGSLYLLMMGAVAIVVMLWAPKGLWGLIAERFGWQALPLQRRLVLAPETENGRKTMSTIIDIYCHIFPDRYFQEMTRVAPKLENIGKRLRGVTKLFDLDARFKEMDEFGDYRQIISLPNPAIEDIATPDVGLNLARIANDSMAELCRKHPERFPAFAAALCMTDVAGSVAEARRAVKDLGARGVLLYTNVAGRAARRSEVRADLRRHGRARSADLAASGRHRGDAGLSGREEIALRDVVVLPLAV